MSVERRGDGWRVRWRDPAHRSRQFDRKRDADLFDADIRRRRQLGSLAVLDAGTESLDRYLADTWAPVYGAHLAAKTRSHYAQLYDHHIGPDLGRVALRDITPEAIATWQARRLAQGAGPVAVVHAFDLLNSILQRAYEGERISSNPARRVRKARRSRRREVRPLPPATVETMRAYLLANGSQNPMRDATLISVLAYSGVRPGEALALRWRSVRTKTLLIEGAISVGMEKETKTRSNRTVRLLGALRSDLLEYRLSCGGPADDELVFPAISGGPWSEAAYASWRRRAFRRALAAADVVSARPYDLRHSFASLLLHEGRSVIYVARQLGHDARLTLTTYGHVIDELEDTPREDTETVIRAARENVVPVLYPKAI